MVAYFCEISLLKIKELPKRNKEKFCPSLYFKIRKFIFRQSESCVLTMSSWSRRVKSWGLKSSVEVQQPTVSGNLKKMLNSCLCTSFVSCYCVLTEKIDKNGSVVTIDHFSHLLIEVGISSGWVTAMLLCHPDEIRFLSWVIRMSRITSRLLQRLECEAWRIVASQCVWSLSHPDDLAILSISSGWLVNIAEYHPDDLWCCPMSSGWDN